MPYRVVQWSTGNVGRHALAGIDAHPGLELVGLFVSNPAKVGRDAGELAGLGRTLGVAGTSDIDTLLALAPDCIVHTSMADDRLGEALADLERFLAAGINVVSSGPVFLQFPEPGDRMAAPLITAAEKAGVSLFVNGVDPGFANDALPLVLSGICERIEEVRCSEVLNYNTYNQPMVLFDIMGFGRDLHEVPLLLAPGVLTSAWGSVVRQIAAGRCLLQGIDLLVIIAAVATNRIKRFVQSALDLAIPAARTTDGKIRQYDKTTNHQDFSKPRACVHIHSVSV